MTKKNKRCEKCIKEKNFGFCNDESCSNKNFKIKHNCDQNIESNMCEEHCRICKKPMTSKQEKRILENFLKNIPDYMKAHWGVNEENILLKAIHKIQQQERERIIKFAKNSISDCKVYHNKNINNPDRIFGFNFAFKCLINKIKNL